MTIEELAEQTIRAGTAWNDTMKNRFQTYAILLNQWNQKMNLTAVDQPEEVYEKHFLDCILPLKTEFPGKRVCDVGSGAGFPGLVFAIADTSLEVTLVEPTGKRCRFLEAVCSELSLDNVTVVNARAEDYAEDHRESFDVVTARAVASLPVLSELCIPLVRKNGIFLAMKAEKGMAEAEEGAFAVKALGCRLSDVMKESLPDGSVRINLVYAKEKNTPPQYPRPYAKIKKKPLGL